MMALPPDKLEPPAGNGAAELQAWLVQYGPALRQYFRRRASAAEAEDLVQEVFMRLLARADGQAIENVERYLFRIANNVLISRHRHDSTQVWKIDENSVDPLERTEDISPERVLIGKQTLVALAVAIRDLPPVTREIFVCHRFEDMTYLAIARRMGVSVKAIEKRMQRALMHINEQMGRGNG
jgi:RNA polymerase sigma factor (sigma-70 family)